MPWALCRRRAGADEGGEAVAGTSMRWGAVVAAMAIWASSLGGVAQASPPESSRPAAAVWLPSGTATGNGFVWNLPTPLFQDLADHRVELPGAHVQVCGSMTFDSNNGRVQWRDLSTWEWGDSAQAGNTGQAIYALAPTRLGWIGTLGNELMEVNARTGTARAIGASFSLTGNVYAQCGIDRFYLKVNQALYEVVDGGSARLIVGPSSRTSPRLPWAANPCTGIPLADRGPPCRGGPTAVTAASTPCPVGWCSRRTGSSR